MTLADALPLPTPADKKPRRRAAAVAGVVGVGAVVGGGAWAWQVWSTQGPQPAEALPASTLAYVAVDLAPTGGQKLAAFEALRKFPSLKKELNLGSQDDLRRSIVDEVTSESGCDIDSDAIEEWAGERAAVAVVPVKKPELVVVVQVNDADKAKAGLEEITKDCGDDDFGYAVDGDWVILAESDKVAGAVRSAAATSTLAEDADYRELTGAAGDPGVMTLFAAPAAGQALLDAMEDDPFLGFFLAAPLSTMDPVSSVVMMSGVMAFDVGEDSAHSYSGVGVDDIDMPAMSPEEERLMKRYENYDDLSPAEQDELDQEMNDFFSAQMEEELGDDFPDEAIDEEDYEYEEPEVPAELKQKLQDFSGIGGVVRFDDGTLEAEVVADPIIGGYAERYDGTDALAAVADLPADTALAFGGGLADGWAEDAVTGSTFWFGFETDEADLLADFNKSTGLTPADLEDLGGDSVAFVARSGFEKELDSGKVATFPIAARITGDADKIEAALAKVRTAFGAKDGKLVESRRTSDGVVIGPNTAYLDDLVDPGKTLGDSDRFQRAVPDADDALAVIFADADAGNWLPFITESEFDRDDTGALDAAGLTVTKDGDQHRLLLRVTLD